MLRKIFLHTVVPFQNSPASANFLVARICRRVNFEGDFPIILLPEADRRRLNQ